MGVLDTTYTFTAADVVTSAKLNNVIDQTTFTATAITGTTLALSSGQLKVNSLGIGANELADNSVNTAKILDANVTTAKILDGSVTQAKTNNSLVPTGAIMAFGMNSVPTGWLACNGQTTAGYTALAALVGANVPDLRGYFVRGSGINGDNVFSGAFGVKQGDDTKPHTHGVNQNAHNHGIYDPGHAHFVNDTDTTTNGFANVNGKAGTNQGNIPTSASATNITINNATIALSIQNSSGIESRPYNIALLYCIKY